MDMMTKEGRALTIAVVAACLCLILWLLDKVLQKRKQIRRNKLAKGIKNEVEREWDYILSDQESARDNLIYKQLQGELEPKRMVEFRRWEELPKTVSAGPDLIGKIELETTVAFLRECLKRTEQATTVILCRDVIECMYKLGKKEIERKKEEEEKHDDDPGKG